MVNFCKIADLEAVLAIAVVLVFHECNYLSKEPREKQLAGLANLDDLIVTRIGTVSRDNIDFVSALGSLIMLAVF